MKESKVYFKNSAGENICGLLALPKGHGPFPAVVGMHGFRTNKCGKKMTELAKRLPETGIAFLRIDFSGLGESEGNFIDTTIGKNVDECDKSLEYLESRKEIDNQRLGLFGSSMGGMVAIIEAAQNSSIKAMILASPVTNFNWIEKHFSPDEIREYEKNGWAYTESTTYKIKLRIGWEFVREGRTHNLMELAKHIKAKTLIVHGTGDKNVSIEDSMKFIQNLRQGEMHQISGSNHFYSRPSDFSDLLETTLNFFQTHL